MIHAQAKANQITSVREYNNNQAFIFLLNSGKNRLKQNRILKAYSEFKLAKAIHPGDEALNTLLIETVSILCEKQGDVYCQELDTLLNAGN